MPQTLNFTISKNQLYKITTKAAKAILSIHNPSDSWGGCLCVLMVR